MTGKKNMLQNLPSDRNYNVSLKLMSDIKKEKIKNKRKFFSLDEKFGDLFESKNRTFICTTNYYKYIYTENRKERMKG